MKRLELQTDYSNRTISKAKTSVEEFKLGIKQIIEAMETNPDDYRITIIVERSEPQGWNQQEE